MHDYFDKLADRIRISDDAALVLTAIHLNASDSLSKISERTGIAEHRTRYIVQGFKEKNLIKKRTFSRTSLLGLTQFMVFVKVVFVEETDKQRWLEGLLHHNSISKVIEMSGRYNYGFNIYERSAFDAGELVKNVCGISGCTLQEKSVAIRTAYTLLRRRIFSPHQFHPMRLRTEDRTSLEKIDDLDLRILSAINQYHESTRREVARQLQVPYSTFKLRVRRLQEIGLLLGEVYGIYTDLMGILTYNILVRTRQSSPVFFQQMELFLEQTPGVYVVFEFFGEWDISFGIEVFDPKEIGLVLQRLSSLLGSYIDQLEAVQLTDYIKMEELPRRFMIHE